MATYTPLQPNQAPAFGTSGDAVKAYQTQLNAQYAGVAGYTPLKVDGLYGVLTQGASQFKAPAPISNPATPTAPTITPTATNNNTGSNTFNPDLPVSPENPRPPYVDPNEPTLKTAQTVDEMQAKNRAAVQAQIDDLNSLYEKLSNEQRVKNDINTRKTNAVSVLSGLAGSSEAKVQDDLTNTGNDQALSKIEAERKVAVNAVYDKIRTSSVEEAKQSRLEARQSEQDRMDYRLKAQKDAKDQLTAYSQMGTGATLAGLKAAHTPEDYDYLLKYAGGEEGIKEILFLNRPKDTVIGSPVNVGGNMIQYFETPKGDVKSEVVPLPEGIHPDAKLQKIGNTLYSSSDGGNTWKTVASGGTGTGTPTVSQQKVALQKVLTTGIAPNGTKIGNPRGSDGFADPAVYIESFKNWTGTAKDFLLQFPVEKNVNPASYNLLPDAIKPATKKGGANPYGN